MCEQLGEIRAALTRYAGQFDAATACSVGGDAVVADAAAIEAMAATIKALAASWQAGTGGWRQAGHRSAAEALARATGTSLGAARETLDTGKRLESQPEVADAARRGELSASQATMITVTAAADPTAARRLVAEAKSGSLAELREECARTRAAAETDLEERRRRIQARRGLRSWTDLEGVWHLVAQGNPDDGARIMAALAPLSDELFNGARAEGRREPAVAYAFDALVRLATEPASAGRRAQTKIIARIDWETLVRATPRPGEVCELVGYGPVPVSVIRDLMDTGDPFLAAVVTRGDALVGVAHLGRRPNARQQTALEWLYPSCAAEGCPAQAYLENDHRIDWAKTHYTMLDLLDRLCSHHHDLKSREGWGLVEGRGKRPFVSPDDPRHPRRSSRGRPPVRQAMANGPPGG